MRENRLLERIRVWNRDPLKRNSEDPQAVIDSVLDHLQRILNTRQGSVMIGEDYGVPGFTDLRQTYPDGVRDFERSIRMTIQKFEPRLQNIRVHFSPIEDDVLALRFQISGKLIAEGNKKTITFNSVIGTEGQIQVKR